MWSDTVICDTYIQKTRQLLQTGSLFKSSLHPLFIIHSFTGKWNVLHCPRQKERWESNLSSCCKTPFYAIFTVWITWPYCHNPPSMLTSPCCTGFTQIIVENCQFSQINSAAKNTEILTDTNYQNQLNENPFIRAFSFPQRDEVSVNDIFLP